MSEPSSYIGRFAPSPTGPLHFGSLLAAVASYLEARRHGGRWLVRIEDIDPPREQPGAAQSILAALDAYGLDADAPASFQSRSEPAHVAAVATLLDTGNAYYCDCTRKDLADEEHGPLGAVYPGTCRNRHLAPGPDLAIRVLTGGTTLRFSDRLQGRQAQSLDDVSGDFVIRRRDGLVAYQLAVVVDDYLQGITDVVRGIDLMDSTPRQIRLQGLLGYPTPNYAHVPIAVDAAGRKLSKATRADALRLDRPGPTLFRALRALRQSPPAALEAAPLATLWSWALESWRLERLCTVESVAGD